MTTVTITSNDTLTLFDRVLTDMASDDVSNIAYDSDLMAIKTGKNENTVFTRNESGRNGKLTLRIIRGSSDDRFLMTAFSQQQTDPASAILAQGQFVKRLGDGQGTVVNDVYQLYAGIFSRNIDVKENVNGDTEQAVAVYTMLFAKVERSLQ